MLLLGWLHWFVSSRLQQEPPLPQEHKRLFRLLRSTIHHGLQIFDIAYSHPLWLARECGQSLYLHLTIFLNGYHMLARQALDMHMSFFALKPKFHGLKHVAWDLRCALQTPSPLVLNPAVYACDLNEDAVGKLCSLALVVSTRTINYRVIQRSFLKKKAVLNRHLKHRAASGLRR